MNKFKKTLYDVTRIYAKNYLTGNLGKVVEDICFNNAKKYFDSSR